MAILRPESGLFSLDGLAPPLVGAMGQNPFFESENFIGAVFQKPLRQLLSQLLGILCRTRDLPSEQLAPVNIANHACEPDPVFTRPCARPDRYLTSPTQAPEKTPLGLHFQRSRQVMEECDLIHQRLPIPALQTQSPLGYRAQANFRREVFADSILAPYSFKARSRHNDGIDLAPLQFSQARIYVPAHRPGPQGRAGGEGLRPAAAAPPAAPRPPPPPPAPGGAGGCRGPGRGGGRGGAARWYRSCACRRRLPVPIRAP